MNFALIVAAGLVMLPIPGGGMIRNQVMKRVVSSWVFLWAADDGFGPGVVDLEAGEGERDFGEIEVEGDKKVQAPAPKVRDEGVRITLVVMPGGEIRDETGEDLPDEEAVRAYLREKKNAADRDGNPRLRLRVAEDVAFAHVRRAIGLAAKEGLKEVIFVTLGRGAIGDDREQAAPARPEAELRLPEVAPEDDPPLIKPFFIKIDDNGHVFANSGAAQELLDADPRDGRLPLLDQRLKSYVAAARLGEAEPAVWIYVAPKAAQARVMDVLDLLRKHEVDAVTFTDLVDAE